MVFNCFTRIRLTAAGIGRSRAANVATIFALTLPIVVGAAGFGVETSYWYYNSLRLQATADAAAYAGALEQISGSDTPTIVAAATQSAATNGLGEGTIVVNTPPASGPNTAKKAVEVIVGQKLNRMFTSIFTQTQVPEQARAVALITNASKACMLALDPTASQAALFSGNTSVKVTGCSVMANSIASDAIKLQGSAGLQADCLITAGGVSLSNPVTTVCAAPITQALPAADPFAGLPAPAASNPCQNANKSALGPGTYCNGLSLSGSVTLQPGVYVIQGGDFKVNANANVAGDGVLIYLAGGSRVSMNGNATVNLSAATSGTYSGVLMYGDRTAIGGQSTFNGTATSLLTGALYFPKQQVNYLGNFSGQNGCTQVVADMIQWSGNSTINQDCTSLGMRDIPATQSVALVE
ncbi:pilus assembly protein TadG-related protein [Mesorhizobium sp. CO1-1-7]|uniref:pilus assembly protein TadG-related protein n=1 Tax=unclassified Mesorhizobium TaxID=325217 RepID=UPI001CCCDABD|nr:MULTISPECIES: pilus assembly protein TadG-related protein [unclassified Mesorhizobium]MBZ9681380.1 pilus assembly protein TadG-related protein [Mesorhizobium sp. CO1-1-2]MBZ9745191.1 pilus assembly protein TadG-related protein [Mesorhizobium sp. CO1-1-7]MBZ9927742.1 pilus assembly protein TadG-related protein [Mesorhizobium sp. BR1-1-4]